MKTELIEKAYAIARERYAEMVYVKLFTFF